MSVYYIYIFPQYPIIHSTVQKDARTSRLLTDVRSRTLKDLVLENLSLYSIRAPVSETMAGDGVGHRGKCERYGWVFTPLPRPWVEGWFWGLFAVVLVSLIVAGQAWALSEKLAQ
jgi:hypothetical protein